MQALGYLGIFAGALILIAGVTGSTIPSVAKGAPDRAKAINPSAGVSGSAQAGEAAGGVGSEGAAHSASSSVGKFGTAPSPSSVGAGVGSSHAKMVKQAYVRAYAKNLHWSAADWEAIIDRESGWDPTSTNGSTGAYGIGQFNPSTEHAHGSLAHPVPGSALALYAHAGAASPDWRQQIHAMALYIYTRYGNPTNALAHEHSAGWY